MNSTYWLNTIMDTMYTNNTGEFYVGLSSTLPNKDGSGVSEPSGGNYSRAKVSGFTAPSNGKVSNSGTLKFPCSTGAWFDSTAKAAYWVLFDGSGSNAHVLSGGNLSKAKSIEDNVSITIAANELSISLADLCFET